MNAMSLLLSLVLCANICWVMFAATTLLYQFDLSDDNSNMLYPEGDKEYHCFDVESGNKIYVRGTYGHYGYFEGAVDANDPQVFYVNWYEVPAGTLTPTSGAAKITYSAEFDEVTGPYWNSGSSDFLNSFGTWRSTSGSLFVDDSTLAGQISIRARCLFPGASHALARADIAALKNTVAITGVSLQGQNSYCFMPAGPNKGSWFGTYTYVYGDDDGGGLEEGNSGTNSFAFWGKSGMGSVETFHASTGAYAGVQGSGIYMISADKSKTYIVGNYCNVNDKLIKTNCFTEYYEVANVNENANDCPSYYRLDNSLDPLYEFASTGSSLSDPENDPVPMILAILFGCLSGVLMLVVVYLIMRKPKLSFPVVVAA